MKRLSPWLLPLLTLALMAGILLGERCAVMWPCLAGLGIALLLALLERGRRMTGLLLCGLCLGMVLGQWAWHPELPPESTCRVTGVVRQEVETRSTGQVRTSLSDVTIDGEPLTGYAYWSFYADTLPEGLTPGAKVTFTARLYHPSSAANPGGFDFRAYLLQHNTRVGLYGATDLSCEPGLHSVDGAMAILRHRLYQGLLRTMGNDAGSYAGAMLLGVRSGIEEDDRQAFNSLGVGHLLSVSGFHVGVLYAAFVGLLALLRVPKKTRILPLGVLLMSYILLTGGNAPVVRASILCLLNEWGRLRGRKRSRLHLICGCALIQLVLSPVQLTGAGFQLSYGAMLGISLVSPLLERARFVRRSRVMSWALPKWLWTAFAMAPGAQLGVLLPQLYWYQQLPVLSILFNMLLMGLASGLLSLCWFTLALMWVPGLGTLLGKASGGCMTLLLQGVRTVGSQNWLMWWTGQADLLTCAGWLLVMAGLCCLWRMRGSIRTSLVLTGVVLMVASVYPQPVTGTAYVQLAVGDADAAVLTDNGTVTVIDTGEDATLASWLHRQRLGIDHLILTHMHHDHAAGVADLLSQGIPVKTCYVSIDAAQGDVTPQMLSLLDQLRETGTQVVELKRGDIITLPSGSLTVLWPEEAHLRPWQDANDGSLVLLAELRGVSMLLTGDMCGEYEAYVQQPADILKVPHHGSHNSSSPEYLDAVNAQVLLLSCAYRTREEDFSRRVTGGRLYSTCTAGAITVTFTGEGRYTVSPYLQQRQE